MDNIIIKEDYKSFRIAAYFLIGTGIWVASMAMLQDNFNSLFMGLAFAFISVVAFFFVLQKKLLMAKLIWAFCTPAIIVLSCLVAPVASSSIVITYSYALIGGSAYVYYSFSEEENTFAYIALAVFTIALGVYDLVIFSHALHPKDFEMYEEFYTHLKTNQALHFFSIMYLIHIMKKNKFSIQNQLSDQVMRLRNFTEQLISISKNKTVCNGFLEGSLYEIAKYASQAANVSRVSIWRYDEEKKLITYMAGYSGNESDTFKYRELPLSAFPNYTTHLLKEKIVRVEDAITDDKTSELKDYLNENRIVSMMDCPVFVEGEFAGILCCEEQRFSKEWDEVDQLFCQAMAQLVSVAYYSCARVEFYNEIQLLNKKLEERNKALTDINGMIKSTNKSPELNLNHLLSDTESIRIALGEYSYKNSHEVRGPLSRILGLITLYKKDESLNNRTLYMEHIEKSAQELDDIIKEMTMILNVESKNGSN